ncbi:hypothetical protein TCAL_16079 [Tigriopus californicus]|uniref:RNA-directed DNA polymerase n=1 Tax=Tigriopus californicus TaxID=6832 RepID=A0A553PQE0_TIGCA|nr:hypothetical protein TCAL_16079 [Tigriopus californicus]
MRLLLKKNVAFLWLEDHAREFERVKDVLCSEPIMKPFDTALPTKLLTDASRDHGFGYALVQTNPLGHTHLGASSSREMLSSSRGELVQRSSNVLSQSGLTKTLTLAWQLYFWPEMAHEIKQRISSCEICQSRFPSLPAEPLLMAAAVASFPMQHVSAVNAGGVALLPLAVGDRVTVQDPVSKRWMPGSTILERMDHGRSYVLQSQHGAVLRRNRRFLCLDSTISTDLVETGPEPSDSPTALRRSRRLQGLPHE